MISDCGFLISKFWVSDFSFYFSFS